MSFDRGGLLFQNLYASVLLTATTSVAMGLLGRSVAALLGINTISVWEIITVAFVGGLISSAVVLAVTVYLSIVSFRRGWDLDSVGAPLITTIGDIVTLPSILLASYLVTGGGLGTILGIAAFALGMLALIRGWTVDRQTTRRIVRESFPVLSIAIVLDILAGTVVEPRIENVLAFPAVLLVIPGFLEKTGALGAILAARLGSKLHLGAVTPRAKPDAAALLDGSIVFVVGLVSYAVIAVSTLIVAELIGAAYPGAFRFFGIVMTGGVMATLIAAVIGYYAATTTYRFGFDPDNHTIPLVTSGMDLLGVICLVVALALFGVA